MAETSSKRTRKRLRFTIEYTVDADLVSTREAMDRMRALGEAEIVDVDIVEPTNNGER